MVAVRQVTALFGLSGVGKTTLARRVADACPEFIHAEGGALLASALHLERDQLRLSPPETIRRNQQILVQAFDALRQQHPGRPVLFEGHLIIDNGMTLVEVPVEVVRALRPEILIWVFDDPSVIAKRRSESSRVRPARPAHELASQQTRGEHLCREYALKLEIDFVRVHAEADEELMQLMRARTN